MTLLWRILLRPWLPQIERIGQFPPLPDPVPGPEYQRAMTQAKTARDQAQLIISTMADSKRPSTRPA